MSNKTDGQSEKVLQLDQQYVSYIVAGFLLVSFFIFFAGYYWGKKQALEPLTEQLVNDSLADKIYCALYEELDSDEGDEKIGADTQESDKEESVEVAQETQPGPETWYYAKLAGFGSAKAAQACVAKFAQKGLKSHMVERSSKTAKGSVRTWYQVVSYPYEQEEELRTHLQGAQGALKLSSVSIQKITEEQRRNLFEKEERLNA